MVVLIGKSLGDRQHYLNKKVADVVANKKNFDEIKDEEEATDIDRLYKIDIASQYKNVDYILTVLKSGDSLYISRALKCLWLYEDCNSHYINAENLHNNIFPYMSIKMSKKMLSTVSIHIRNKDRAASFFTYCKKNNMRHIAFKFLNTTSEEFKLHVLKSERMSTLNSYLDTQNLLKNFVVNSFALATAYLEIAGWGKRNVLHNLRFLYSVSNEKYLDLLEEYEFVELEKHNNLKRFGIRISKDIMCKHKNRVLSKPLLYVNKLNKSMLVKFTTVENTKTYIMSLMPDHAQNFWDIDFCNTFNYILDLLPINEKFKYMKQLFASKYPNEPFEMSSNFYDLKCFKMLSVNERELWALSHIDEQKEILGSGNDYIWYKFVNVDKALIEIKKYIMITPDKDKRSSMINILVESSRNQDDLLKVLNYYYDRHVNESVYHKEIFIDKVLHVHNVFEFNIDCWDALNKLFYSLEIYTVTNYASNKLFKAVAVFCHIFHNQDLPQALTEFIELDINYSYFNLLLKKFGKEKADFMYQYLLKFNITKLNQIEQEPNNKKLKKNANQYVNNIYTLLNCFERDDKECPEIARKYNQESSKTMQERKIVTAVDIFRFLKKDASLAVDVLDHFEKNIDDWPQRLNNVLRKLKVYFLNDVAQEYIKFLDRMLLKFTNNYNTINVIIFAIFQLADENFKVSLMEKYHPTEPKIDHRAADGKLRVQKAICKFVGYSRPPVPLESVLKYIKGDYVHDCLPMFNMYLVNHPLPLAIKFTEATLNAPLSVQKHGIRLAFNCFTINDLKNVILNVWKKSKNVSLRMLLYKSLFNKIKEADEDAQIELYEVLKLFTTELGTDDQDEVFYFLSSDKLSDKFIGDYLRTSWEMIIKLPEKRVNMERQRAIIYSICRNINLVDTELVRNGIIKEHIHEMLEKRRLNPHVLPEVKDLSDTKWHLTATYIVNYNNDEELKERLHLLTFIFERCVEMWNEENFISRRFYFDFIQNIKAKSSTLQHEKHWTYNVPIFQHILNMIQKTMPIKETYLTVWDLQVTIFARTSSCEGDAILYDRDENFKHLPIEEISARFAYQIGTFVKDLLEKQQFYSIFLPKVAHLIDEQIQDYPEILKQEKNFVLFFCESMANLETKETHLLTLIILPEDVSEEFKEHHTRILKKIQAFDNDEIQSYYYSEFCYTPV